MHIYNLCIYIYNISIIFLVWISCTCMFTSMAHHDRSDHWAIKSFRKKVCLPLPCLDLVHSLHALWWVGRGAQPLSLHLLTTLIVFLRQSCFAMDAVCHQGQLKLQRWMIQGHNRKNHSLRFGAAFPAVHRTGSGSTVSSDVWTATVWVSTMLHSLHGLTLATGCGRINQVDHLSVLLFRPPQQTMCNHLIGRRLQGHRTRVNVGFGKTKTGVSLQRARRRQTIHVWRLVDQVHRAVEDAEDEGTQLQGKRKTCLRYQLVPQAMLSCFTLWSNCWTNVARRPILQAIRAGHRNVDRNLESDGVAALPHSHQPGSTPTLIFGRSRGGNARFESGRCKSKITWLQQIAHWCCIRICRERRNLRWSIFSWIESIHGGVDYILETLRGPLQQKELFQKRKLLADFENVSRSQHERPTVHQQISQDWKRSGSYRDQLRVDVWFREQG